MDQQKARHEINHPAEKGHGHGPAIIVENIADVFLVDNFYVKGQIQEEAKRSTLWLYLFKLESPYFREGN